MAACWVSRARTTAGLQTSLTSLVTIAVVVHCQDAVQGLCTHQAAAACTAESLALLLLGSCGAAQQLRVEAWRCAPPQADQQLGSRPINRLKAQLGPAESRGSGHTACHPS